MENALKSTKNINCDTAKSSPEKGKRQTVNTEATLEEGKKLISEVDQEKGMKILEWLASKGIRRAEPS
jgi:hypothetical protein